MRHHYLMSSQWQHSQCIHRSVSLFGDAFDYIVDRRQEMGIVYPVYIVRCSVGGRYSLSSPLSPPLIWTIHIPPISPSHSSSHHPIRIVVMLQNLSVLPYVTYSSFSCFPIVDRFVYFWSSFVDFYFTM